MSIRLIKATFCRLVPVNLPAIRNFLQADLCLAREMCIAFPAEVRNPSAGNAYFPLKIVSFVEREGLYVYPAFCKSLVKDEAIAPG